MVKLPSTPWQALQTAAFVLPAAVTCAMRTQAPGEEGQARKKLSRIRVKDGATRRRPLSSRSRTLIPVKSLRQREHKNAVAALEVELVVAAGCNGDVLSAADLVRYRRRIHSRS